METDVQPTDPKPQRRWHQYRPQILVVLMSVLIVVEKVDKRGRAGDTYDFVVGAAVST
jgi:hypothetical protein